MNTVNPVIALAAAVAAAVVSAPPVLHAQETAQEIDRAAELEREAREMRQEAMEEARRVRDEARRRERERAHEQAREQVREQVREEREQRERRQEFQQALREARRALDEGRLELARERFRALSDMEDLESGAPLYWLAYADAQGGRVSDALESLGEFFRRFPRDVFFDDALALRIELARKSSELPPEPPLPGQPPEPMKPPSELLRGLGLGEAFDQAMEALAEMDIGAEIERALVDAFQDFEQEWEEAWEDESVSVEEELRLLALDGLMETNPDRAFNYLREFIVSDHSAPAQSQALTLLSRTDHPQTPQILLQVVRSAGDEGLRREALRVLGLSDAPQAGAQALLSVYTDLEDEGLRRAAIEGLMLSNDVAGLLQVYRQEPSADLRAHVARHLGMLDALDALREVYEDESSARVQAAILDGFALAGDTQMLLDIALDSDEPAVVERAVRALAVVGYEPEAARALSTLFARYRGAPAVQQVVADTLASMDAGDTLVDLYRQAQDVREKTLLVERLRMVGGDAAEQVFLEILEAG